MDKNTVLVIGASGCRPEDKEKYYNPKSAIRNLPVRPEVTAKALDYQA